MFTIKNIYLNLIIENYVILVYLSFQFLLGISIRVYNLFGHDIIIY